VNPTDISTQPLKEHLTDISELVVKEKADLVVVDPDVDLAFVKTVKCLEKNILSGLWINE
jgi:phosphomannomutase